MRKSSVAVAILILGIALLAGFRAASALPPSVQANPTVLVVYADGTVSVNQTLALPNNLTSLYVPLLTAQVGDILVVNQAGGTVSYQLNEANMTVYSLGATVVTITYDTDALTSKTGGAWTVSFTDPFNATVILPAQSTILSLSGAPTSVSVSSGSPVLLLPPGSWIIGYGLSLSASSSTSSGRASTSGLSSSTASSTSTSSGISPQTGVSSSGQGSLVQSGSVPFSYVALSAALVSVAILGAALFVWRRRSARSVGSLRPEDVEMLRFIRDKGGKTTEAELRERFSLPRTSQWRQVRRLEQLRYVRVTKSGQQNAVELLRSDFDK